MPSGQQIPPNWLRPVLIAIPVVYFILAFATLILQIAVPSVLVYTTKIGIVLATVAMVCAALAIDIICFRFRSELQTFIQRTTNTASIALVTEAVRRLTLQLVVVNILLVFLLVFGLARVVMSSNDPETIRAEAYAQSHIEEDTSGLTVDRGQFLVFFVIPFIPMWLGTPPDFVLCRRCSISSSSDSAAAAHSGKSVAPLARPAVAKSPKIAKPIIAFEHTHDTPSHAPSNLPRDAPPSTQLAPSPVLTFEQPIQLSSPSAS